MFYLNMFLVFLKSESFGTKVDWRCLFKVTAFLYCEKSLISSGGAKNLS